MSQLWARYVEGVNSSGIIASRPHFLGRKLDLRVRLGFAGLRDGGEELKTHFSVLISSAISSASVDPSLICACVPTTMTPKSACLAQCGLVDLRIIFKINADSGDAMLKVGQVIPATQRAFRISCAWLIIASPIANKPFPKDSPKAPVFS